MSWKYDYLVKQIHRTAYKCHESFIIGALIHDAELAELKPCTQFYVKRTDGGYALIDLYYPQLDFAIEIDEPHHLENGGADDVRQSDIERKISCRFERIKVSEGDVLSQIAEVKKSLLEELKSRKNQNRFNNWLEPKTIDIFELKKSLKNSLIIKIKGEVAPDKLMAKQTGFWRIDKSKRGKIDAVYIVHDGTISRVFTQINWYVWEVDPAKVGYRGVENDSHELVGTIVANWKTQQTVTYSNDVY